MSSVEAVEMGDISLGQPLACGLSKAQKRIWYGLNNQGDYYRNLALVYELQGPVNQKALEEAVLGLLRDNRLFDTVVVNTDKRLINKVVQNELPVFHTLSASADQSFFLIQKLVEKPFDLVKNRLYSVNIIQCARDHFYFVFVVHPLLLDRHSLRPLAQDLAKRYNALCRGEELPRDVLRGNDYLPTVASEQAYVDSSVYEQALNYWSNLLKITHFQLNLPIKGFADEVYVVKNRIQATVSLESMSVIHEWEALHGVDTYTVMMTILQLFLYRYTHKEHVIVNYNVRPERHESENFFLGRFDNILSCSIKMTSASTVMDVLKIVDDQLRNNAYFSHAFRTDVVKESRSRFDGKFSGEYSNVSFDYYCYPYDDFNLEGIKVIPKTEFIEKINEGDIIFYADTSSPKIVIELEYHQRFDDLTCSKMLTYFMQFIDAVCRYPHTPVVELPILPEEESSRLLSGHADRLTDLHYEYLMDRFSTVVENQTEKIAIREEDSEITYGDLDQRISRLASSIRHAYIKRFNRSFSSQTLVGICMEKGIDAIIAILAVMKAGAAYVVLSPDYPESRLQYIIEDSQMDLCITNMKHSRLVKQLATDSLMILQMEYDLDSADLQSLGPLKQGHFNAMACLIYTSGSTGNPKGVQITQLGIARLVCEPNFIQLSKDKVIAHTSNLAFDASLLEIFGALLNGATLVIPSQDQLLSAPDFSNFLKKYGVDVVWLTVALFNRLATENPNLFSRLDYLMVGGDALNPHVINLVKNAETGGPHHFLNGYGPTENTTFTTTYEINKAHYEGSIPIGRPISGTTCYVLDQHMKPCPVGIPGELYIGGIGLASGYWRRSDISKKSFVQNPFVTEEQSRYGINTTLYKTGDRVRWLPSGEIDFIGRIDDQVKIRGFRIELGELETVLRTYPLVQNAVVLVKSDSAGEKQLVAYYRLHDSTIEMDEQGLKNFLMEHLPSYYLPSKIIQLDSFPITPNGKVDKQSLPNPFDQQSHQHFVSREAESILRQIWSQLLSIPESKVGYASDFFQEGGHSLLVTLLISKIDDALSVSLSVKDIFTARTFSGILDKINSSMSLRHTQFKPFEAPNKHHQPLSFALKRGWYLYQQNPDSHHYNIPFLMEFKGPINIAALQKSLIQLFQTYDIFNTHFESIEGEVRQSIVSRDHVVGHRHFSSEEALMQFVHQAAQKIFHLERGDYYAAYLLTLDADERAYFYFNVHHALFDGWSLNIFMQVLSQVYEASCQGETALISSFSHLNYCYSQDRWCSDQQFDDQLAFWQNALSGELPVLSLPTDYHSTPKMDFVGRQQDFDISPTQVKKLKALAVDHQTSLFNVVMAAYFIFLHKLSGQNRIVIGTPTANRNHAFTHDIVGCLVNTLAYPLSIDVNERFVDLVNRLSDFAMQAMDNQDVPFDQVVEHLRLNRESSSMPVFQTLFVLQSGITLFGDFGSKAHYQIKILDNNSSKYDLSLVLYEAEGGGLTGFFEYRTALFEKSTIARFIDYFQMVLLGITQDVAKPIKYFSLLSPERRHELLHDFAQGGARKFEFDLAPTAIEYFAYHTPHALAVDDDVFQLTYAELDKAANGLAKKIRNTYEVLSGKTFPRAGVLGLLFPRGVPVIVTMIAAMKLDAVYLPLDKNYPLERLEMILSDANPIMIISDEEDARLHQLNIPFLVENDVKDLVMNGKEERYFSKISPRDAAYLIFTSGSTGRPKGVLSTHLALANMSNSCSSALALQANDAVLQFASLNFDASLFEIFITFSVGAHLHIVPESKRYDPELLGGYCVSHEISVAVIPPVLLEQMGPISLPSLKTLVVAGDVCKPDVLRYWSQQCQLYNAYGPTECGVCATMHLMLPDHSARNIGKPISNVSVYVLDGAYSPTPIGVAGELYLGGLSLAQGYLNNRAQTIDRFIPDPFNDDPQQRLYKTGDLVKWNSQGELEFIGRNDHQVKIRGFRIELDEVGRILSEHPNILQSIVVAPSLEGRLVLAGYYVCHPNQNLSHQDLLLYLKQHLPSYMVPQYLMELDHFVQTPNGKIDRTVLPEPSDMALSNPSRLPESELELGVAQVFCEVLSIPAIGMEDNFFDRGGSSISSVVLVNKLKEKFPETRLALSDFYVSPTLAHAVELLSGASNVSSGLSLQAQIEADTQWDSESLSLLPSFDPAASRILLLTGATGFLGVHLLASSLLKPYSSVYCLLRNAHALERLKSQLIRYGLEAWINHERVIPVYGDLSQPQLGLSDDIWQALSEQVTDILHNGALVNHLYHYHQLKGVNVDSTRTLLDLATSIRLKKLNFVSTYSAAQDFSQFEGKHYVGLESGYLLTKQVAETLLLKARSQGVPVNIFRPGNITGQLHTGRCAYESNHQLALIKACIQMQAMPRWSQRFEMTPVDFLASHLLEISYKSSGDLVNYINPVTWSYDQLATFLRSRGYKIQLLDLFTWKKRIGEITEDNALYPFKHFYEHWEETPGNGNSACLPEPSIKNYPDNYQMMLSVVFNYLEQAGFFA